jgi:hypothetical protein
LTRKKDEKGILVNRMAIAVQEAREKERKKHESPEYQAARQRRRERRAAREAAEEEERRAAREAEKEKERLAREAEKEREKAAKEAAAAAKENQKLHSERRRRRRTSFAESSNGSTAASPAIPGLLKIMTKGESDCGGPLLKINLAKASEKAVRSGPASRAGSERQTRSQHSDEIGEPRRRHRERRMSSRHESSKDGSSRADDVPAMKVVKTVSTGLKAIFAH